MAFIEQTELKSAAVPEVITKAINNDTEIVDEIISETEAVMRSYLSGRFNVTEIFNATAGDRNGVVLKHFKKIVIDEIYKRKAGSLNDVTQLGYDEAMTWLEGIASGKIDGGDLPLKEVEEDTVGDGFTKLGGNTRYPSNF